MLRKDTTYFNEINKEYLLIKNIKEILSYP